MVKWNDAETIAKAFLRAAQIIVFVLAYLLKF